ncbi:MAG: pyridoxal kinase [Geminicoccaceae bacterium]
MPSVISLQSHVSFGFVGNRAAEFTLQRLGFDVWPLYTVRFSNHVGYPTWQGRKTSAEELQELIDGLADRGCLTSADALLSGYLGSPELAPLLVGLMDRLNNPSRCVTLCDPVMGDHGKLYVAEALVPWFRDQLLSRSQVITPNLFELGLLAERPVTTVSEAVAAARQLLARGPSTVYVTSVPGREAQQIAMLAVDEQGTWQVETPRFDAVFHGTGDTFAALLLAGHLRAQDPAANLENAASCLFAVVEATVQAGGGELKLIEAQDVLLRPPRRFQAERLD